MTKKADFYDSYEEVFVSPKDIKEGESYTVARVLEGKYCVDLHYCSTYKPSATIEYGIKDDSGNWQIEVEEIDWFNKKLTNDYILVRLNNLYNDKFLNIKLTEKVLLPISSKEINVEYNIPISLKMIQGAIPNYYFNGIESKSIVVPTK